MSYSKGDVYLYSNGDYYVCHECKMHVHPWTMTNQTLVFDTRLEAVDHLREHLRMGHNVSARAFIRLWREIELNKEKVVDK